MYNDSNYILHSELYQIWFETCNCKTANKPRWPSQ